jgi:putative N6-adenine-specific DNA methylase
MLGAQDVEQGKNGEFWGGKDLCTKLICHCIPFKNFKAYLFLTNEQALYKGISGVNWSRYINANQTFVIDATVHSDNFNHSEFVSQNVRMQ